MLTKEERAAVRIKCKEYLNGRCVDISAEFKRIAEFAEWAYLKIMPALLDALDEADHKIPVDDYMKVVKDKENAAFDRDYWKMKCRQMQARVERAERSWAWANQEYNRLQARCEALERANKRHAPCETCIYLASSPYVAEASHYCDNCEWWRNGAKDLWQFDEARFGKGQSDE